MLNYPEENTLTPTDTSTHLHPLTGALHKYSEVNNDKPSRVIVYRDGLSDDCSMVEAFTSERDQILNAFRESGDYE